MKISFLFEISPQFIQRLVSAFWVDKLVYFVGAPILEHWFLFEWREKASECVSEHD